MTAAVARHHWRAVTLVGLAATVMLAAAAPFAPGVVLRGWLIGFASVGGVALGASAWLAVHGLTGGRWGEAARPALLAAAGALPAVILAVLPLLLLSRFLFPWAADPSSAGPGVAGGYLNTGFLALRSLVLLGAMAWLGWRAKAGALPPLLAGGGLAIYGVLANLAAFDWLLSLDPRYTSSAIGMQMIVAQFLSALCVATLLTRRAEADPVWGDFGGLLLACLLGEGYLLLMTYVVHWYGNLPVQAAWYLQRSTGGWRWLVAGGSVFGGIAPGLALLFSGVRTRATPLRATAVLILAGLVLENIWLVAPSAGPDGGWAALAGLVATVACSGIGLAVSRRLAPDASEALHAG